MLSSVLPSAPFRHHPFTRQHTHNEMRYVRIEYMSGAERKCWIRHAANCVKYPIHSHSHPFLSSFYERKFLLCCLLDSFRDNSSSLYLHSADKMRVKVTTLDASTLFIAIPHNFDQRTLATCINNWFVLVPHSLLTTDHKKGWNSLRTQSCHVSRSFFAPFSRSNFPFR